MVIVVVCCYLVLVKSDFKRVIGIKLPRLYSYLGNRIRYKGNSFPRKPFHYFNVKNVRACVHVCIFCICIGVLDTCLYSLGDVIFYISEVYM